MQGQRRSIESLSETFEFDHGSISNNSGMDHQIYNILNQVETQNLMYMDISDQDNANSSIWSPGGPSSSEYPIKDDRHGKIKMETSLAINAGGGPRIEERHFDGDNMLSLENVNINLNSSQADDSDDSDDEPSFPLNCNLNDVPQTPEHDAVSVGISNEVLELEQCLNSNSGILKLEHAASSSGSSNPCMDSSGGVSFMLEDGDDRPGISFDGRRLACKRKTIEGFPGQSSSSGSTSFFHQNDNSSFHSVPTTYFTNTATNVASSSNYLSGGNSFEEQLNPRLSTIARGMASDCYPSPSVADSSHRNFRMRVHPGHQHDISPPNVFTHGSTMRRSSVWSPNQPSSHVPLNQSLESRPAIANFSPQSQPHIPIIPGLPRSVHPFPWNELSNSRIGSSSNVSSEERLLAARDDLNSRNIPRNNFLEHSLFVPTTNIGYVVQEPTNWSPANGSTSMAGNVAHTSRIATSSAVHPPIGPNWAPNQSTPTQYPRSLSEAVSRSFLPSGGSDTRGNNFLLQHTGHSSTSQEIGHQPAGLRGHQQPYMRSAFLLERQNDGVMGVPMSMRSLAAAREARSRMISEIRNALDVVRRGEQLRFEDVVVLNQSRYFGGAELHDQHRDMRLDVDNMSYEELLALEERIGNVSTGLSEETVLKCLKQRKQLMMRMDEEPCCICQEEYVEGEDLGALDCGHDFHTACIKQWLTRKNLCPVCKTTALVT